MNSRMNGVSAIFLLNKLKFLRSEIQIRKIQINLYLKYLKKLDISFLERKKDQNPSNHIFLILTKKRNGLKRYLEKNNIETLIHYPIIPPLQNFYKNKYMKYKENYSKAEKFANKSLSLPIGSHLTLNDIRIVSRKISKFFVKN